MPAEFTPLARLEARFTAGWRRRGWQTPWASSTLSLAEAARGRLSSTAWIWLLPLLLGSVWPVLLAFWWRRPVLAVLNGGALVAGSAAYVVLAVTPERPRRAVAHALLAVVTLCLTVAAALTNGLASPTAIWLYLVPMAAMLGVDRRAGSVWTIVTALVFAVLLHVGPVLAAPQYVMPHGFHSFGRWLSMASLLVFVVALLAAYDLARRRSWASLVHKQAELEADVLAREKSETDLRLAEARYRSLVERMPAITYSTAMDGSVGADYVSPQVEAVLGFSPGEWLSTADFWVGRLHPEDKDQVLAEYGVCLEQARPFKMEYRFLAHDGKAVWVRDESVVVRDGAGSPIFLQGIMTDISEHRRLAEKLVHSQKMETVGRLAGGVAHDFNNLLTVIQGSAAFALDELVREDGQGARGDLEEVLKAAERAKNLTGQLLAFSRRQVIEPRVVSLNTLILDMDKMLRRLLGEDIELVTLPMPGLGFVKVDAGQMEQVLANLAVNARDAMPNGGTLTIETNNVTLGEEYVRRNPDAALGDFVMVAVSDTGCGMSRDVQEHIFEPFYTTKGPGRGTGLGLATVYGIVRQHGGTIGVYSEPGVGSVFKVHLPRVGEKLDTRHSPTGLSAALRGRETILVAEDEPSVRVVATRMLRQLGYHVLEAGNGDQAMRLASRHQGRIDLLLTDVVMPQMSGGELAEELRRVRPDVAVVFVSGYTDNSLSHHLVLDSTSAYLEKPFTETALAQKLREVLDHAGGDGASLGGRDSILI